MIDLNLIDRIPLLERAHTTADCISDALIELKRFMELTNTDHVEVVTNGYKFHVTMEEVEE